MTSYPTHKATFGSLAILWFIWLLLVAAASHATGVPPVELAAESSAIFRETAAGGGAGGKLVHPQWHLNYMSKRRVPNGPDPIHNRRAGNSGRPPGKA
ncbi:CLAVATA3/ESR (CLE)-related protein 25-like [Momordica charantia]|uniref:CLAVATA3/ESR (CLE)-related protein 25-like n=1 Tax=Momordica charantia TaxID=3673 RepID=A0A6J1DXT1_MOMCH|nr:CLAVATA3/ESR (CLE)-related protein 25-like [Momordica charantia]